MTCVVIESPYAGNTKRNLRFARACVRDCLERGEAPIASHLVYTQDGILDDGKTVERDRGMAAGHAWISRADLVAVYTNLGITDGMKAGIQAAEATGTSVEYRKVEWWV